MEPSTATEQQIHAQLVAQGLSPTRWSNGPDSIYAVHDHPYAKVLVVVEGGITFTLEPSGQRVVMKPGDRLDIPSFTPHSAVVGPDGVVCLEAHLQR